MAGKLAEKMIPKLQARYAGRGLQIHEGKQPFASFPAAHPDVGDMALHDDDHEVTLYVGQTHGHFSPFNYSEPVDTREAKVVDEVIAFLDEIFDDKIEFWTDGNRMGGWNARGQGNILGRRNVQRFVWSGPLDSSE